MNENENISKDSMINKIRFFFRENPALSFLLLGYAIALFAIIFMPFVILAELACNGLGIASMVMAIKHMQSSEGKGLAIDIICLIFGNPLSQIIIFVILDSFVFVGTLQALGQMG